MIHKNKIKLAAALLASTLIAAPIASAYAAPGGYGPPSEWSMSGAGPKSNGECAERGDRGAHGARGEHHKGRAFGHHARERSVPLSASEARTLIDAMLLKTGTLDIKTADTTASDDPDKVEVTLVNAGGDVVEVIKFEAKTGKIERDERRELRKLMARPDRDNRYNNKYTTDQMTLLVNAMVIRFGNGDLKLGDITETPRGTYNATVTNQAGDIVREMELSRVTGRPIS